MLYNNLSTNAVRLTVAYGIQSNPQYEGKPDITYEFTIHNICHRVMAMHFWHFNNNTVIIYCSKLLLRLS